MTNEIETLGGSLGETPAMSNRTEALLLRAVAEKSQASVAQAIKRDSSQVSRFFTGQAGIHIHELEPMLKTLGLAIIPCEGETVTIPREEYQALKVLARKACESSL